MVSAIHHEFTGIHILKKRYIVLIKKIVIVFFFFSCLNFTGKVLFGKNWFIRFGKVLFKT